MNAQNKRNNVLADSRVSTKIKIASMWTSFMFLYAYVDYFHLYMPGSIENIIAGKVFVFDISYVFLSIAMTLVAIPVLMIFLSIALPAGFNRRLNMIVATLYIPYMLFNLVGDAWLHMYVAAAVEVGLLLLIIGHAWKMASSRFKS